MYHNRWFIGLVMVPTAGDYVTTVVGVGQAVLRESNPVARTLMELFGPLVGFGLLSLLGVVVIGTIPALYARQSWFPARLPVLSGYLVYGGLKTFATVWNLTLIL